MHLVCYRIVLVLLYTNISYPIGYRGVAYVYATLAHLAPQFEVTPVEFFSQMQLESPGLSCGVVSVILRLAVLIEHRLATDRRTREDSI